MRTKAIILQAIGLIALGAAAGFADSLIRPVMVQRPAPPPIEQTLKEGASGPRPGKTEPPAPAPAKPAVAPMPEPSAPATAEKFDVEKEVLSPDLVAKGHITVKQANDLFNRNPPAAFIDARRKEEYQAGHIDRAFRVTLAAFSGKTPRLLDLIDRAEPVVVYCVGGNCDESEAVAKQLSLMGYAKVYVMHEGYSAWAGTGYPIEIGEGLQEDAH